MLKQYSAHLRLVIELIYFLKKLSSRDVYKRQELCLPLIRPGGTLVCYKGPDVQNELNGCEIPLKRLGGAPPKALECTGLKNSHKLIIIRKISHTPPSFPRKAGIPAKNPLF